MRIKVDAPYGHQTCAYAEYRVFSSLKRFAEIVQRATVTLTSDGHREDVVCRVVIEMTDDRRTEAAAAGRHPYGAIDRVAQDLESSMQAARDSIAS